VAIQVGKIAGIPIALDYSWFVIFLLIAWTVGFNMMPATYPGLGFVAYLFIGILSSFLLFGSVLVHELAHSIVAKRNGLRIRRITLFLFGGVSEIEEEPSDPWLEMKMAAAGPLTSVALAGLSAIMWQSSVLFDVSPLIQAPLQYCSLVNAIVAAFNLIPAFPMDGGRVLRSLIWSRTGDIVSSTRTASTTGRAFAYAMIFIGIFLIFAVDVVTGFWLIIIGWFISTGAQSALAQTIVREDLRGLRANDIMTRRVDSVPPDMTLEELSQEFFRLKHNGFPVISGDELAGCVTTDDLRKARREAWRTTTVKEVMTPKDKLVTVGEEELAAKATGLMTEKRIGRVFVTNQEGKLSGIITRSDVMKVVQLKEGLSGIGAASRAPGKVYFTVEPEMNFVLEQPTEPGLDWKAEFSGDGIQLVKEAVSKTAQGHEMKQFVFHAGRIGEYSVRLVEGPKESSERGKRKIVRTVTYVITVGKPS
jgi:Zn-dependent protease